MNEYEKTAEEFCKKHGVKLVASFKLHGRYFTDDKEERDVFRIRFSRTGYKIGRILSFTITFGQSLQESTGDGLNPPSAYSVLACIEKNDPGTLENWCSEFGYTADSKSATKTYKEYVKQWKEVSAFFTEKELIELQEIN